MFDVERDGWKAETQILLTKVKTGGPSGLGQIWVSNADEQPQPPNPKQPQAGPSHKKESGFEQLDKVGPEDYNKLLKQWMVSPSWDLAILVSAGPDHWTCPSALYRICKLSTVRASRRRRR